MTQGMNYFVQAVASVLEVPEIGLDDAFRDAPGWCSLQTFGLLVLLENDWRAPVTLEDLKSLKTVRDLYRVVFIAFAARLLGVPREALKGSSAMGDFPQWDSVNHLRLFMEAERTFGVAYALADMPGIRTIDAFLI